MQNPLPLQLSITCPDNTSASGRHAAHARTGEPSIDATLHISTLVAIERLNKILKSERSNGICQSSSSRPVASGEVEDIVPLPDSRARPSYLEDLVPSLYFALNLQSNCETIKTVFAEKPVLLALGYRTR